ncbi:MAG TPA: sigma factor-like helix-turn-helix DNA-binding protein [Gemmatimonadales bacterium]|nr:sigma factor-like helix-turn-helix DNA-binding protein [Gemmatimonadales bacterium]
MMLSATLDESALIQHARRACSRWKAAHRREVDLPDANVIRSSNDETGWPLDDPTFDTGIVQLWLLKLPQQQRAAVVFREFRGGSFEHVARCLDCSVSAAKTHYQRGIAALRRQAEAWNCERDRL